jgi:hypothetical protein
MIFRRFSAGSRSNSISAWLDVLALHLGTAQGRHRGMIAAAVHGNQHRERPQAGYAIRLRDVRQERFER